MRKLGQPAVGIPNRAKMVEPPTVTSPKTWQFVKHDHKAQRAGCFAPGTRILLASGDQKKIESVEVGDLVWTAQGPKKVIRVWDNGPVDDWMEVTYGDIKLICTPNHPFWLDGVGWVAIGDLNGADLEREKVCRLRGAVYAQGQEDRDLRESMRGPTQPLEERSQADSGQRRWKE